MSLDRVTIPYSERQGLQVNNIFISSRMSLCRERDAAYHSVADLGFHPLLFEREIEDSNSQRKMELMIDSSELLVSIYNGNGGTRKSTLSGLTPMEYEFWRFILRFGLGGPDVRHVSAESGAMIEREIESSHGNSDPHNPDTQRLRFIRECIDSDGRLYEAVRKRVLVVVVGDVELRNADLEFLRFLPEECLVKVRGTPIWKAHLDVYQELSRRLQKDVQTRKLSCSKPGLYSPEGSSFLFQISGIAIDEPGVLKRILYSCFKAGLNLRTLDVKKVPGARDGVRDHVRFEFLAEPSRVVLRNTDDYGFLREGMKFESLTDVSITERASDSIPSKKDDREAIRVLGTQSQDNSILLIVPFIDVQGALLEIVEVISQSKLGGAPADIRSIVPLFSGAHKAVQFRLSKPPGVEKTETNFMEYRLHAASCVLGAAAHGAASITRAMQ